MKNKMTLAAALAGIVCLGLLNAAGSAATDPVPCEKMLGDLRAATKSAKLSDADTAKVADLQTKGIERCKADDDAGADAFFAAAMTIVSGK